MYAVATTTASATYADVATTAATYADVATITTRYDHQPPLRSTYQLRTPIRASYDRPCVRRLLRYRYDYYYDIATHINIATTTARYTDITTTTTIRLRPTIPTALLLVVLASTYDNFYFSSTNNIAAITDYDIAETITHISGTDSEYITFLTDTIADTDLFNHNLQAVY